MARELRPSLEQLTQARTVAVFGASDRSPVHRALLDNVRLGGRASVAGVNPNRDHAHGMACYPSAAELPFRPDAAVVLVGDERVEPAVEDALLAGARAVVIPGLGHRPSSAAPRE